MNELKWSYSDDQWSEEWSGTCASRQEAIEQGTAEYGGKPFYVASFRKPSPLEMFPRVDDFFVTAGARAYEEAGVEDWPALPEEERARFAREYVALILRYFPDVPFYVMAGGAERIDDGGALTDDACEFTDDEEEPIE